MSIQRTICASTFKFSMNLPKLTRGFKWYMEMKVIEKAGKSADLKISKPALLPSSHHNFSNTEPI